MIFTENRGGAAVAAPFVMEGKMPPETDRSVRFRGHFTMAQREEGFTYFPNALDLYKGFGGYVYTAEADCLPQREKMPWAYKSASPIPVTGCRHIPDLYAELLTLEAAGDLKIIRFGDLTERKLQGIYGMLRRSAQEEKLKDHPELPYAQFYQAHFPFLL